MDGFIKGIIQFLSDNPWFTTLLIGFIAGLFVGMKMK